MLLDKEAGRGWLETACLWSPDLPPHPSAVCLEKYPCCTDRYNYIHIYSNQQHGSQTRACPPTARHHSRRAGRGPARPAKPLSPFPKSLLLLAFPIPEQSDPTGEPVPPFLQGKGDFLALGKAGKTFLAAHSHFQMLFLPFRPPQTSPCPLLEYVPFAGGCVRRGGGGKLL